MEKLNFVALDFEMATRAKKRICQIGLVKVEDSCVVAEKCWLVKPPANKYDSQCVEVHHITPDMTANMPEFDQVWPDVFAYIDHSVVVAHHAKSIELAALTYALEEYGIDRESALWPEFKCYCSKQTADMSGLFEDCQLSTICRYYNVDFMHHNAMEDAKATAIVMLKMQEEGLYRTFSDLKCIPYNNDYHVGKSHHGQSEKRNKFEPNKMLYDYMANVPLPNGLYRAEGMRIVLTGFEDKELKYRLEIAFKRVGAMIQTQPNRLTDLMIVDKKNGWRKLEIANSLGIEQIDFKTEFIDYFNIDSADFLD
ncbi:MAG: hypothetical protein IKJ96_03410 [Alistipes sp.]|nr:hypothetical protein [Alistipes sp.]